MLVLVLLVPLVFVAGLLARRTVPILPAGVNPLPAGLPISTSP